MKGFFLRSNKQRGYGVYTTKKWQAGDELFKFAGEVIPKRMVTQDFLTLNEHFCFEWRKESIYSYLNHSCNPNCYINLSDGLPCLMAMRDISDDEELTYNYNTVEVEITKPFPCSCNDKDCIGWIKGFLYLTPKQEEDILVMCTPYIKKMQEEYQKYRDF